MLDTYMFPVSRMIGKDILVCCQPEIEATTLPEILEERLTLGRVVQKCTLVVEGIRETGKGTQSLFK